MATSGENNARDGIRNSPFDPHLPSILVVDDSHDSANTLCSLFGANGYNTHVAYDGLAALEAAKAHLPDVILLDLGMPELDGVHLARFFREDEQLKDKVLIAITGHADEMHRTPMRGCRLRLRLPQACRLGRPQIHNRSPLVEAEDAVSGSPRGNGPSWYFGPETSTPRSGVGRSRGGREVQCRIHQRDVRERLGKVADQPAGLRVVFLRNQTDVVAKSEQTLEKAARFGLAAQQVKVVRQPKRAGKKDAFADRQTVDRLVRNVTGHEAVGHETLFDGRHRAAHACIADRQKSRRAASSANWHPDRVSRTIARRSRVPR